MLVAHSKASVVHGGAAPPPFAAGALRAIHGEVHVHGGVVNRERPLRLGLALTGLPVLRVSERRGDAIGFDSEPLAAEDLADGSRVEVHDLTEMLAPGMRGTAVESLAEVRDGQGGIIGVALLRAGAPSFCIWVEDDEFTCGDEAALKAAVLEDGAGGKVGGPLRLT